MVESTRCHWIIVGVLVSFSAVCTVREPKAAQLRGQESDDAPARHVQGLEEGLRGPLARAATLLQGAINKTRDSQYRQRLERERVQMDFTLGQTKLFYQMLKSEWLYRVYKRGNEAESGLEALAGSVLAQFSWEEQNRLIARSGLRGQ